MHAITQTAVELSRGAQAELLRMKEGPTAVWTEQQSLRGLGQCHSLVGLNRLDLVVALRVLAIIQQSLIHCDYLPGVVACRDAKMPKHRSGSGQGWAAWPRALPPSIAPVGGILLASVHAQGQQGMCTHDMLQLL